MTVGETTRMAVVKLPRRGVQRRRWEEPVICSECKGKASLVYGNRIYPGGEFNSKMFWLCSCGAYVGCHPKTSEPLGTPAGKIVRGLRMECHARFDALWRRKAELSGESQGSVRKKAYSWLRKVIGCSKAEAHIGKFTERECRWLLKAIDEVHENARAKRMAMKEAG